MQALDKWALGLMTVRGYKSEDMTLNGFGLTQWVWSGRDGLELSELVVAPRRSQGVASSKTRPKTV